VNQTNNSREPLFTFLSKINHDLRTPLTAMLNMIALIKDDPQLHCTPQNLKLMQEAGEELKSLLYNVTDLAKLEVGSLKLKIDTVSLHDVLNLAVSSFSQEIEHKHLSLRLEVDSDLPDRIMTDKHRLLQVLSNLISNAVNYTERGEIILRATRNAPGKDSPDVPRILFSVEDSGAGISEDRQVHLFDHYLEPEGDSLLKTASGSGLGLAVSKRLVQLMGGRLSVRSAVAKGSTFSFDLPCRKPAGRSSDSRAPVGPPPAMLSSLGPLRVLVVEDNFINLLSFSQMLERYGFVIQSASNGKQALDYLQQQSFDLILMDVKMPIMDGLEATRRIRDSHDRRISGIKVIALTAYALPEDRQRIFAAGVDDIVSKPIEVEELASVLRRVLGR
jgi:CheY-like chemotaxis protein